MSPYSMSPAVVACTLAFADVDNILQSNLPVFDPARSSFLMPDVFAAALSWLQTARATEYNSRLHQQAI